MATTKKTLVRLPKKGQIAGVCAGIADYLDLDVTLVRVVFVLLAFATGGLLVILYLVFAIIIPADSSVADDSTFGEKAQQFGQELQDNNRINSVRTYFGVGLLVLGGWLLLRQFFPEYLDLRWEYIWPLLLILSGFLIISKRK